jgi:ribose 5-phosphate isomerase A
MNSSSAKANLIGTSTKDLEKEAAGRAGAQYVKEGQIVGLGTGSTALHAINALGERVKRGLKILGIPTSKRSHELALSLGIPLTTFEQHQQIDVTIDGADEFDPELNLIKGGGGALLREKIVASATKFYIIVTDDSKQVTALGKFPLPVEVIPFAEPLLEKEIAALGATTKLRRDNTGDPYLTDEKHHILDCSFRNIADPAALALQLSQIPGVVEHGLFIGLTDLVLVCKGKEVLELRRPK